MSFEALFTGSEIERWVFEVTASLTVLLMAEAVAIAVVLLLLPPCSEWEASTCFLERWRPLCMCRSQYFWSGTASLLHLHFFPSVLLHLPGSGSMLFLMSKYNGLRPVTEIRKPKQTHFQIQNKTPKSKLPKEKDVSFRFRNPATYNQGGGGVDTPRRRPPQQQWHPRESKLHSSISDKLDGKGQGDQPPSTCRWELGAPVPGAGEKWSRKTLCSQACPLIHVRAQDPTQLVVVTLKQKIRTFKTFKIIEIFLVE